MKVSIFGLGYVGCVTAGCLADAGHEVVGVDVNSSKVNEFSRGQAPIVEPGLGVLLRQAKENGLLRATTVCAEAVAATDISLICVGTPSTSNGTLDLSSVERVAKSIADGLWSDEKHHVVIMRSTVLP